MGAPSAASDYQVNVLSPADHRHHLCVVLGVDELGPEQCPASVSLRRAAMLQTGDGLTGVFEQKLSYVPLSPAVLVQHTGMLRP